MSDRLRQSVLGPLIIWCSAIDDLKKKKKKRKRDFEDSDIDNGRISFFNIHTVLDPTDISRTTSESFSFSTSCS